MKINKISIYRKDLTYVGGSYAWGRGNVINTANSSVVVIETDKGLTGVGEFCPCGENYMVAHSEGTQAAATLLAPRLLGQDPRQLLLIEQLMDSTIQGHGYAKAPFDAACWDLLGKSTELPVWMLMGGKLTDGAPMYRVVPQKPKEEMVEELNHHRRAGYKHFQIKVGNDVTDDIERIRVAMSVLNPSEKAYADANQGWTINEAIRVVRAVSDVDVMIEQPCHSYEECLHVRQHSTHSMKLDECVTDIRRVQQIIRDKAADVLCLKISNLGGLTKAKRIRDVIIANGLSIVAEDTWGGEITTAALSHFAASTPEHLLYNTTDLCNYNNESTGINAPETKGGKLYASDQIGLGVEPDYHSLGDPVAVYQ